MKPLIALAFALLTAACSRVATWPGVEYSEVRGYAFNLKGGPASIIVAGKLNSTVVNEEGALLTKAQVNLLIAALTDKHAQHPAAACFNPRHAFVFYDKNKAPVATVDVCFECLGARANPTGTTFPFDYPALAELCAELKLQRAPDSGFRKWFLNFSNR